MLGSKSVPPAISIASGPSPARMRAASATVFGARYSNQGSASCGAHDQASELPVRSVAAPGGRHDDRLGIRHRRKMRGAPLARFSLIFLFQCLQTLSGVMGSSSMRTPTAS